MQPPLMQVGVGLHFADAPRLASAPLQSELQSGIPEAVIHQKIMKVFVSSDSLGHKSAVSSVLEYLR